MDEVGPGSRPVSAYTTTDNAGQRATYLATASNLMLVHLPGLARAWNPRADNYRAEFVSKDVDESLKNIITGIGEPSRGELTGERMTIAYEARYGRRNPHHRQGQAAAGPGQLHALRPAQDEIPSPSGGGLGWG